MNKDRKLPTNSKSFLIFLAVMSVASSRAEADQFPKKNLRAMTKASQLVVLAKVESATSEGCPDEYSCVRLKVEVVLKGPPTEMVTFAYDSLIAEDNPDCCDIGSSYLFFLKKIGKTVFESSNGPYGVFHTSPPEAEPVVLDD